MAQHDQIIANDSGANVRADINALAAALFSNSSGSSAPSTTIAYQWWMDTTNNVVKRRNAANSGWLVVETLDESRMLARSSNTILGLSDFGKSIHATGTFTQTLTAAATLGDGWWIAYANEGTGIITFDPNGSETIAGATTMRLYPGESCIVFCNGTAFKAIGRSRGLVLLETETASSSLTLDFTSVITSDFSDYELRLESIIPATDNVELWLRTSIDNGSTWASTNEYTHSRFGASSAGTSGASGAAGDAKMVLSAGLDNTASRGLSGTIRFSVGLNHFHHQLWGLNNDTAWYSVTGGGVAITNQINAVRLLMSSGNIASGTAKLYGVR